MERVRRALGRLDVYDAISLGFIAVIFLLALAHWGRFPLFKDIYYHMGAARSFGTAGGIPLHDFWEFAPAGRAHLYPPLLHIIMYGATKLGLSMTLTGQLVSFGAFHLVLVSTWYGMRRLFSSKAAFYSLIVLSSCFIFFWQAAVTSAASLVLIITPFVFIAVEDDHKVTAAVLLGMAFYSHLVLGHVVALGLFIYALHRREYLKRIVTVLAGAYVLWLPWGLHILFNYQSLDLSSPMGGGEGMTLHLVVWGVALAGLVYCYFKRGRHYLLAGFLLGMVPIIFFYAHRFWDGHVFVPLAMLGGVALAALHDAVAKRAKSLAANGFSWKAAVVAAMAIPVALLLFVDPVFTTGRGAGGNRRPNTPGLMQGPGIIPGNGNGGANGNGQQNLPPQMPGGQDQQDPAAGFPPPPAGFPAQPPGGTGIEGQPSGYTIAPPSQDANAPGAVASADGADGFAQPPPDFAGPAVPGGNGQMAPGGGPPGPSGGGMGPRRGVNARPSTLLYLFGAGEGAGQQSLNVEPMLDEDTAKVAALVEANSEPGQIVWTSDPSLGNLLTGLTGRPSNNGMFREVRSEDDSLTDGAADARVVVMSTGTGQGYAGRTMSGPTGQGAQNSAGQTAPGPSGQINPSQKQGTQSARQGAMASSIDTSKLKLLGNAGQYTVYLNESADTTVGIGDVVPWYVVIPVLALLLLAIVLDYWRPGPLRRWKTEGGRPL